MYTEIIENLIVEVHKEILGLRAIERLLEKINYQDYDNNFSNLTDEDIKFIKKCITTNDDITLMKWYKMKNNDTIVNLKTLKNIIEMRGNVNGFNKLNKEEALQKLK